MQPTYDPAEDWDAGLRAYFEAAFGREHFARMAAALLRPPLSACLRINPLRTTTQVSKRTLCQSKLTGRLSCIRDGPAPITC